MSFQSVASSSSVDPNVTTTLSRNTATLQQKPDGTWVKIRPDGTIIDNHYVVQGSATPINPTQVILSSQATPISTPVQNIAPSENVPQDSPVVQAPPLNPPPEPDIPMVQLSSTSQVEQPRTVTLTSNVSIPLEPSSGHSTAGVNTTLYRTTKGPFIQGELSLSRTSLVSDFDFTADTAPGMTQNVDTIISDDLIHSDLIKAIVIQLIGLWLAYWLGTHQHSYIWLTFVLSFLAYISRQFLQSLARKLRLRLTQATRLSKTDTEIETVEWLNSWLERYWLHFEPYFANNLKESLNSTLRAVHPPAVDSLQITEFTLGTSPPRVDAIKTFKRGMGDTLEYLLHFAYLPLAEEELTARKVSLQNKEAMISVMKEHAIHMENATTMDDLTQKLSVLNKAKNTSAAVESIPVTKRGRVGDKIDGFTHELTGMVSKLGKTFRPVNITPTTPPTTTAQQEAEDLKRLKELLRNDVFYDSPMVLFGALQQQEDLTIDVTDQERLKRSEIQADARIGNQSAISDPRNVKIVLELVLKVGVKVKIPISVTNVLLDGSIVVKTQFGGGFPHLKKVWLGLPVDSTTTQVILPAIDFELKPLLAFDLLDVPGLSSWLMNLIRSRIATMLGPPGLLIDVGSAMSTPLLPDDAVGVLHLKIVKARGLIDALLARISGLDKFDHRGVAATTIQGNITGAAQTLTRAFTKQGVEENVETMKRGINNALHLQNPNIGQTWKIKLGCKVVLGGTVWPGKVVGQTKFIEGTSQDPEWHCDLKILVPRLCLTDTNSNADVLTIYLFATDDSNGKPVAHLEGLKISEWIGTGGHSQETQSDKLVRLIRQRAWRDCWGPPDPDHGRGVWKNVWMYDPEGRFSQMDPLGNVLVKASYWTLPTPQERAAGEAELEKAKHEARKRAYNEAMKETDVDPVTVAELAGQLIEETAREAIGHGIPHHRQSGVLRITIHQAKNLSDFSVLSMPTVNTDKSNVVTKALGGVVNVVGATANVVTSGLESLVIGSYSPYIMVKMRDVDPNDLSQTSFSQFKKWKEANGMIQELPKDFNTMSSAPPSPEKKKTGGLTLGRIKIGGTKQNQPVVVDAPVQEVDSQHSQITTGNKDDPTVVYQTQPKYRAVNPVFDEYADIFVTDLRAHELEFTVKVMSDSGIAEKDLGRVWIRAYDAVERGKHVWFKLKGVKSGYICLSFTFTPVTLDSDKETDEWDSHSTVPDFTSHRVHKLVNDAVKKAGVSSTPNMTPVTLTAPSVRV